MINSFPGEPKGGSSAGTGHDLFRSELPSLRSVQAWVTTNKSKILAIPGLRPALGVALGMIIAGCGASGGRPAASATDTEPTNAPPVHSVPRTVITPGGATDVPEMYRAGRRLFDGGDASKAAKQFDQVYSVDPNGELAADALYLSAQAHEQAGDRQTALQRFEQLARRFPKHSLGREALIRAMRLLVFMEQWQRAEALADQVLSQKTQLTPREEIVALSTKAFGQLSRSEVDAASFNVEKARNVIDLHRLDAAGTIPRDLAQTYYALGEIRRLRAERIKFVPVPANFGVVLEERCQLLLDSQRAYSDTMRAYDAHWSAMAGYRVGELYKRLHDDLMAVPKPAGADTEARQQLFEGAMRLRYSVLLDKALAMMEHTLSMAKRTGERSEWVLRAERSKRDLEQARQAENAAIDRLPYSRAQLRQALDDLAAKSKAAAVASEQSGRK